MGNDTLLVIAHERQIAITSRTDISRPRVRNKVFSMIIIH